MAFFDALASKSKDVAEKAKKLAEVANLNSQISSKESEIKNVYREMGQVIYENKETWKDVDLSEKIGKIEGLEAEIGALKAEILIVKGVKICTQCGGEIESDVAFCPKCGAKAPQPEAAEPAEDVVETTAEVVAEEVVEEQPASEENAAE